MKMSRYYQKHVQGILDAINKLCKSKFIIGIDGLGGSGKSTLAKELIGNISNTEIVHMDDFYKMKNMREESNPNSEIGAFFDWRRLESQVLIPFTNNLEISFQKYDWLSGSLKHWQNISKDSNVIVEGVYSTKEELSKYYDFKIWIDCLPEIRLTRGIKRDGIGMKEYWQNVWMKQENEYFEKHKPFLTADLNIISSNA
jgi:uridine kinase